MTTKRNLLIEAETSSPTGFTPPLPRDVLAGIPIASGAGTWNQPKPPRTESKKIWDRHNPAHVYKNVDQQVAEAIQGLGNEYWDVGGQSAVVQECLRYSLAEIAAGRLIIEASLQQGRWRLAGQAGWGTDKRELPKTRKRIPRQKNRVSYRLPPELHHELVELKKLSSPEGDSALGIPLGQLLSRLLQHALEAYEQGNFILDRVPGHFSHSLEGDWR
jgi:hypothetical protein